MPATIHASFSRHWAPKICVFTTELVGNQSSLLKGEEQSWMCQARALTSTVNPTEGVPVAFDVLQIQDTQ